MKKTDLDDESDSSVKQMILETTLNMDKRTLAIWASDCVEHVLHFFEDKYPNDDRPRKAIEVARAAGHAAATAHVVGHAIHAADYAAKVNLKELFWQHKRLFEITSS
ncbi:MAG: putative immunity protein [Candidatus Heimdallarchaeaceae archaeon]